MAAWKHDCATSKQARPYYGCVEAAQPASRYAPLWLRGSASAQLASRHAPIMAAWKHVSSKQARPYCTVAHLHGGTQVHKLHVTTPAVCNVASRQAACMVVTRQQDSKVAR